MPEAVKPADLSLFKRRFEELRSLSASARATRAEIEKYVMPRIGRSSSSSAKSESEASWTNPDRWDSTAPVALSKLAAWVHGSMTPPGVQWFGGAFPQRELNEDKAAREWMDGNARLLWQALEESDFQAESASLYPELLGAGNSFIVQEVLEATAGQWGGLDYTVVPAEECEFEETARGRMKTWFRELLWTPVQIVDHVLSRGGTLEEVPKLYRDMVDSGNATQSVEVLFVVFERPEIARKPIPDLRAIPALRPWGSVYFVKETLERLGEEGGYYDPPAFLARWERVPGSRWAHGLGHLALPATKLINAWLELVLEEGALAVMPPIATTEDGVIGDVEFRPKGIIQLRTMEDLKVLKSEGRFDVAGELLQLQRLEIGRIFKEDALDLKDSPQMTATEAQLRYDRMLKLIGPHIGRLQSEVLDQMLFSAYRAMYRAGRFPEPPPIVKQKGGEFSFTYLGPTARARRMDEVAAIERGASLVAGLMKMGFTDVQYVFDPVKVVRESFDRLGIPSTVLRSEAEVNQARAEQAALARRMAEAEAARAEGEAVEQNVTAAQQVGVTEPLPAQPPPILNPAIPI